MKPSQAEQLARRIHDGDVDKAGEPYVDHLRRVAEAVEPFGEDHVVIAWLHDALEDHSGDMNEANWKAFRDLTRIQKEAVKAITHNESTTRMAYFAKLLLNKEAVAVKAADLLDNSDPARLMHLHPQTRKRLVNKYLGPVALFATFDRDLLGHLRERLVERRGQLASMSSGHQ